MNSLPRPGLAPGIVQVATVDQSQFRGGSHGGGREGISADCPGPRPISGSEEDLPALNTGHVVCRGARPFGFEPEIEAKNVRHEPSQPRPMAFQTRPAHSVTTEGLCRL